MAQLWHDKRREGGASPDSDVMFRRILIPTDFSTASEWAFDEAVHLAAANGSELVILHVRMTKPSHPGELRFPIDPSLYDYAEQQELERLRKRVRDAGVDVATRLLVRSAPDPAAEIARTAASEKIDLIVVATNASHHVAHLIIGSTTNLLLESAPTLLLVIRYGTRKRTSLKRLVVPVSERTGTILELARSISGDVHLVGLPGEMDGLAPADASTVKVMTGSDRGKEIVRYASQADADAILLAAGTDDETLDIVRHAPMPVLVVPKQPED